jgi:predicted TIM-barrel fold metal-dependent hydrolase
MTGNPDRSLTIDTHHHILPDFFWQATQNAHAPVGGLAPLRWSKETSISFMDEAGIDIAVVSLSTPGVYTGDSAKARALARRCNEFSAELVRSRPDRFGGFACLPLPDVDASLEELSYALDVLGLDGFVLFTNSNGVYLGEPVLEPVFEELERRKTVVYVHPASRSSTRWGSSPAASYEAPLPICSAGFIGTPRLPPAILYSACCATWRESIKFCMERIFRIYAGTWP